MARKMTEWPSKRGPITKIMPSNGCIGDTVPLAVGKWYDFHEFGWYMGNVGLNLYLDLPRRGIGVAFIHTPPDQTHGFRMGFRSSDDHVRDINTVIRYLRKELKLPIWLAGHLLRFDFRRQRRHPHHREELTASSFPPPIFCTAGRWVNPA